MDSLKVREQIRGLSREDLFLFIRRIRGVEDHLNSSAMRFYDPPFGRIFSKVLKVLDNEDAVWLAVQMFSRNPWKKMMDQQHYQAGRNDVQKLVEKTFSGLEEGKIEKLAEEINSGISPMLQHSDPYIQKMGLFILEKFFNYFPKNQQQRFMKEVGDLFPNQKCPP